MSYCVFGELKKMLPSLPPLDLISNVVENGGKKTIILAGIGCKKGNIFSLSDPPELLISFKRSYCRGMGYSLKGKIFSICVIREKMKIFVKFSVFGLKVNINMRSTVLCHVNSDFNDFIQTRTVHI
jgi:hypothetical protein